jgi:hypothetical protein
MNYKEFSIGELKPIKYLNDIMCREAKHNTIRYCSLFFPYFVSLKDVKKTLDTMDDSRGYTTFSLVDSSGYKLDFKNKKVIKKVD